MKKAVILFLTILLLLVNNAILVKAKENKPYVITKNTEQFDQFIVENFSAFFEKNESNNIYTIGQGLYLFGAEFERVYYPIYIGNLMDSVIEIYKEDDGSFGGARTAQLVDKFTRLLNDSDESNPASLFAYQNRIYGKIGEVVIDYFSNGEDVIAYDYDGEVYNYGLLNDGISPAAGIITICNWTTYVVDSSAMTYCVPMTVFNIIKNRNNNSYGSWNTLATAINNYCHITVTGGVTHSELENYISHHNYMNCDTYVYSGYMGFNEIQTMISNGQFSTAWFKPVNEAGGMNHVIAVVGINVSNTTNTVIFCDPHGNQAVGGKIYITSSSNGYFYTGKDSKLFGWISGYDKNIR